MKHYIFMAFLLLASTNANGHEDHISVDLKINIELKPFLEIHPGAFFISDIGQTSTTVGVDYGTHFSTFFNLGVVINDNYRFGAWGGFATGDGIVKASLAQLEFDSTVGGGGVFFGFQKNTPDDKGLVYADVGIGYVEAEVETLGITASESEASVLLRAGVQIPITKPLKNNVRPFVGGYVGGMLSLDDDEIPHAYTAGVSIGFRM